MNESMSVAIELMLMGMGTVFVFLVALIMLTSAMSQIVIKLYPDESDELTEFSENLPYTPHINEERLRLVIKEAIKQHRNRT